MARVLVADDELAVREVVAAFLEAAGHEVVRAADGVEARAQLDAGGVEVLVTDLHMPGLDGFGLVAHVASLPRPVPVIMISGTWTAEEREKASGLRIARVYDKPADMKRLVRDVDELAR